MLQEKDEGYFAGDLEYKNSRGLPFTQPVFPILTHVWNHSTWHRGQISTAVTSLGRPAPELDLLYFLRKDA